MNIPSQKECFKLIAQMKMMDHIIDHSIMVSNVALFLCLKLKKTVPQLNVRLARSAALLHDITKTRSFDTNERHSETGGQMLTNLGYPEVGDIIRQHVILDSYRPDSPVSVDEIVNYADKRVLHDTIVSLEKRLEYIESRYGAQKEFQDRIHILWTHTLGLEHKIFYALDIAPDQLADSMAHDLKNTAWT